jgi:BirA family biotin operon repressor/biotin-[acetyl-CoA-carboxylase] ligase
MAEDIRKEVLRLFRERPGAFISGAEISQRLGVTRTAVWKHIRLLREAGYTIDAKTSRGYRLEETPDILLSAEIQADLKTELVGRSMRCYESTDSTNQRAQEIAERDGEDGTVFIAEEQTSGKGRLGRQWTSPPGVNLYASLLLRPVISPLDAPKLTFVAALAVVEAVASLTGLQATVKWPNDVLLNGRKLAGVLSEMRAESDRVHYVILGVGVNLNMSREQFPSDLRYPATSLRIETGQPVSRSGFVRQFLERFEEHYFRFLQEGFDVIRPDWDRLCDLVGRRVRVDMETESLSGEAIGLDEDGSLLVRSDDGRMQNIYAGDVSPA